ncbi:MAG TPA: glycosyltransferase 87 family protein [Actinocrinis sp.]|nr:glycosyltransferase 87 family protein [Actinocrinis sp.]
MGKLTGFDRRWGATLFGLGLRIGRTVNRFPSWVVFVGSSLLLGIRVYYPVPVGLADNSDGARLLCQIRAAPAGGWHNSAYWLYLRLVYYHDGKPCTQAYTSSQLLVVKAARQLTALFFDDRILDLRFVAIINLLLWSGAVALIFAAAPGRRPARYGLAAGILAVLCDSIFADYIISPYSEPAAVTGTLYVIAGALWLRKATRSSIVGTAIFIFGGVFLCTAKTQSIGALAAIALLLALVPLGWAAGWRLSRRLAAKAVILSVIALVVAAYPPKAVPGGLAAETRFNLVFAEILPLDGHPARDIQLLGYPAAAVHYDHQPIWCVRIYDPTHAPLANQIERQISYTDIASFLLKEPTAALRVLEHSSTAGFFKPQPTAVHCPDLNTRMGDYTESAHEGIAFDRRFVPLSLALTVAGKTGFPGLVLLWVGCLAVAITARRRKVLAPLADLVLFAGCLGVIQFITAAFGDGVDITKHMNLAVFGTAFCALGTGILAAALVRAKLLDTLRSMTPRELVNGGLISGVRAPRPAGVGLRGAHVAITHLAARHPRRFAAAAWAACALSFLAWCGLFAVRHRYLWQMIDLDTYVKAVSNLPQTQGSLYQTIYGGFGGPFLYPPFAAAVLHATTVLPEWVLRYGMTAVSLGVLLLAVRCAWQLLGRRRRQAWTATALTFAVVLWLEPVLRTVSDGQVSLILWGAVILDFCLFRSRGQGFLTGVATGFKLTPAIFIVYFLVTGRWREACRAAAAAAATVAIGWVLLPKASAEYWFHAVGGPNRINAHVTVGDATNQSLRALIFRLGPQSHLVQPTWIFCVIVLGAAGLYAARAASLRGDEATGLGLAAVTGLLIAPISWTHHWVPVVLLVARQLDRLVTAGPGGRAALRARLAALSTVALFLVYPMRLDFNGHWSPHEAIYPYGLVWLAPHADSQEFWWTPLDFVIGNLYIFAGVGFLAYHVYVAARATVTAPKIVPLRPVPVLRPAAVEPMPLPIRSGYGRHRTRPAVVPAEPAGVGVASEST